MPGLIRAFRRDHPRVRIVLQRTAVGESGRVSQLLATRPADVELTAERVTGPDIEWRRILVEPFVLAVATTHPLAGRDSVSLAEVADEPFVVRRAPSGMRTQTLALCRGGRLRPRRRVRGRRPAHGARAGRRRAGRGRRAGDGAPGADDVRPDPSAAAHGRATRSVRSASPGSRDAPCCPRPRRSAASSSQRPPPTADRSGDRIGRLPRTPGKAPRWRRSTRPRSSPSPTRRAGSPRPPPSPRSAPPSRSRAAACSSSTSTRRRA